MFIICEINNDSWVNNSLNLNIRDLAFWYIIMTKSDILILDNASRSFHPKVPATMNLFCVNFKNIYPVNIVVWSLEFSTLKFISNNSPFRIRHIFYALDICFSARSEIKSKITIIICWWIVSWRLVIQYKWSFVRSITNQSSNNFCRFSQLIKALCNWSCKSRGL